MNAPPKCGVRATRGTTVAASTLVMFAILAITATAQGQVEPLIDIPSGQSAAPAPESTPPPVADSAPAEEPIATQPAPAASAAPAEKTAPPPTAVIGSRSGFVVQLNQAITLFAQGQADPEKRAEAARLFQALLSHSPDNRTCLYHLGLIEILNGIDFSRAASDALDASKAAADEEGRKAKLAESLALEGRARDAFVAAQANFAKLVSIDVGVKATEGGLYLGIAQLAVDEETLAGGGDERERRKRHFNSKPFIENNQQAESILDEYVNKSEAGRRDPYGRFFLGIARFRLGLSESLKNMGYHEKSMEDFEQSKALAVAANQELSEFEVEGLPKFINTVDYYEGLIYALGRNKTEAVTIFTRLSNDQDEATENVRDNARLLLTALAEQGSSDTGPSITMSTPVGALSLEGNIGIGNFYDTNVILLGFHQPLPYGITRKQDYRFGLDAGFDVTLFVDETTFQKNGWFGKSLLVGIGGQTGDLWNASIQEYQVNTYSGRSYINYEPFDNFYLGLRYDYTWAMLGQDPFFGSNRLIPSMSYSWRKDFDRNNDEITRTDLYYVNDYRDYHDVIPDDRFDRTGEYQAFGVTQTVNLLRAEDLWKDYYNSREADSVEQFDRRRWSRFWLGYNYRDEQTKGTEFDLVGNTLLAGVEIPLPLRLTFDFQAGFSWDDYDHPSALDYRGNARRDFVQDYRFGVTYTMIARGQYKPMKSLEMKVRGSVQTIFEDSNVWNRLGEEPYTYDRALYGLQLLVNF